MHENIRKALQYIENSLMWLHRKSFCRIGWHKWWWNPSKYTYECVICMKLYQRRGN